MIIKSFLIILLNLSAIATFGNIFNSRGNAGLHDTGTTNHQQAMNKINDLKVSMLTYLKDSAPPYTENDVRECVAILNDFIAGITKTNSREEGMELVKSAVLKLNKLNEKCGGELIETSEREQIADIIISEGNAMGYNSANEDITEAWRAW